MRGRRARGESATHGARRARTDTRPSAEPEETAREIGRGGMATPEMVLGALALERAESALAPRPIEHPRRGPARTRRIERAWKALRAAARKGPRAIVEWYDASTGTTRDAMRWVQAYDVIERAGEIDEDEELAAFERPMKRAVVGAEHAQKLGAHARAVLEWDPLGTRPIADETMREMTGGLLPLLRWGAIEERSKQGDGPVEEADWEEAGTRTGLAAWAAGEEPEQRKRAIEEAFLAGDGLAEIEGGRAAGRIRAMMREASATMRAQDADHAMLEGLAWLSAGIEDAARIARALDAVRRAGAHRWRTPEGMRDAGGILERGPAVEAAARCRDRLKAGRSKRRRSRIHARWAECATALGDEEAARRKWGRALTLDGGDASMWRRAAGTSAPPWRLAPEHRLGLSRDDRRLWGAWELAQPREAAARIAGVASAMSAPRRGGAGGAMKKLGQHLARETEQARAQGAWVEARVLWVAAWILQDDESAQWKEGMRIEHALLEDLDLESELAGEMAMHRLAEGRGIEPALEHLMAHDAREGEWWRCEALGARITAWAADDPRWEGMAEAERAQGPRAKLVIERGLRGPAHQREARKAGYARDAAWAARARGRCRQRYRGGEAERLWALLERIAKAEQGIERTHWVAYRKLLREMGDALATWARAHGGRLEGRAGTARR